MAVTTIYATSNTNSTYKELLNNGSDSWSQSSTTSGRNLDLGNFNFSKSGINNAIPRVAKINKITVQIYFRQSRSNTTLYHSQIKTTLYNGSTIKIPEQTSSDVGDSATSKGYSCTNVTSEELWNNYMTVHYTAWYKGTLSVTQYAERMNLKIDWSPILTTGITVSPTSKTLNIGGTVKANYTVSPSSISYPGITWSSSNNNVATVDSNGNVTAKGAGSCSIICTANDGSGKSGSCNITVVSPASSVLSCPSSIELTSINKSSLFDYKTKWYNRGFDVSKEATLDTSENGFAISAIASDTYLNGTYHMNGTASAAELQLVKNYGIAVTAKQKITLGYNVVGNTNHEVFFFWYDSNGNYKSLNNKSNNGTGRFEITFEAPYTGYVCFRFDNNNANTLALYSNITVRTDGTSDLGNKAYAYGLVQPFGVQNKSVTYTSENSNVASVNSNGLITFVSAGTTNIVVKSVDGNFTSKIQVNCISTSTDIRQLKIGSNEIDKIYIGTQQLSKVIFVDSNKTETILYK